MARFRFTGGDQQPDVYGVLEVGDVVEFDKAPDWGDWEKTSEAAERQSTPQPTSVQDEPEPPPVVKPADKKTEA